tara:strand:+ start:402 stop:767 length:366 start_codon:yes stop_codon:yes gene_type:complete
MNWERKWNYALYKGTKLQKDIVKDILKHFSDLDSSDVVSAPECANGADIQLSDKAKELFPYQIEAKNQNRMKELWKVMDQAKSHGTLEPVAVVKRDGEEALLIVKPEVFIKLVANQRKENK